MKLHKVEVADGRTILWYKGQTLDILNLIRTRGQFNGILEDVVSTEDGGLNNLLAIGFENPADALLFRLSVT